MLALLGVGLLAMVLASEASAHARYASSSPDKGEVLAASPDNVAITFSQEIQRVAGTYGISVTDAAGVEFTADDAVVDDADRTLLSVALQPSLPPGRYVAAWTNVSDADGDPAEGAFSFYVGVDPSAADLAADAELAAAEEDELTPVSKETIPTGGTPDSDRTLPADVTAASTSIPPDDSDDGGGNDAGIWIAVAAAAAGVIIGFAGVRWLAAKRR